MVIVGAGISGLLAGQFFRHLNPVIYEVQDQLPNNHSALLRFRSCAVSELTSIPFKEVRVQKGISINGRIFNESHLLYSNLYSQKVNGTLSSRSIDNIYPVFRHIAPHDFIEKAARGLDIVYGESFKYEHLGDEPVISTIPLETLCGELGIDEHPHLKTRPIWTYNTDLIGESDIYQTIYYPDPNDPMYRLSVTGSIVTAEFISDIGTHCEQHVATALKKDFGIGMEVSNCFSYKCQRYGKLVERPDSWTKEIIQSITEDHNIYSLGRWATHRQVLSDDVVNDIHVIDRMIRSKGYNR